MSHVLSCFDLSGDGRDLRAFVFVYGTLRQGHSNNNLLRNEVFFAEAKKVERYTMVDAACRAFPAGVMEPPTCTIHGDLYAVTDETLARLDRLEGTPHHYQRRRVLVETDEETVFAWIYIQLDVRDRPIVESGDWSRYLIDTYAT